MPPALPTSATPLDAIDVLLLRMLRIGLPLTDTPYADLGGGLGLSEAETLARLQRLLASGVVGPLGPLFHVGWGGERFLLAAMQVPEERFDAVAAQVNALAEVTQNVRREHRFNMWFVVAHRSSDAAQASCERIAALTGLPVYCFPDEVGYSTEWRLAS